MSFIKNNATVVPFGVATSVVELGNKDKWKWLWNSFSNIQIV